MKDDLVWKIDADGNVTCLYSDALPLDEMGDATITRASNVEHDGRGWIVIFPLRDGATIPEYLQAVGRTAWRTTSYEHATRWEKREDALAAEVAFLNSVLQDREIKF